MTKEEIEEQAGYEFRNGRTAATWAVIAALHPHLTNPDE